MQQVGETHAIRCARFRDVRDLSFQKAQDAHGEAATPATADIEAAKPAGQET